VNFKWYSSEALNNDCFVAGVTSFAIVTSILDRVSRVSRHLEMHCSAEQTISKTRPAHQVSNRGCSDRA